MSGIALDEISSNLQEFQGEKANFKKVFWSSKSGFWEFSVLAMCPSLHFVIWELGGILSAFALTVACWRVDG